MLYGKVFRSAEPHARLVRIDTARAAAMPGVRAVITAADAADVRYGAAVKDEPVFARDVVRYVGQPLAAVAAATLEAAEAALAAIEAVYEPLPPVLDLAAALAPGAPLVHEGWRSYAAIPILQRDGNVCNRAAHRAWATSSAAGRRPTASSSTASPPRWCTRATPSRARRSRRGTARARSRCGRTPSCRSTCRRPWPTSSPSRRRRCASSCRASGGGFGGKLRVGVEHFAALLARKSGRPVKVMTTSEEELTAAYPRQGTVIELKTGVTRDGRLTARQGRIYFDTGAFAGSGPGGGVGGDDGSGRALPHAEPAPRRLRGLHQQDQLRLVPRAVRAPGQLRGGVADGHHRGRPRHRPAGAAPAQHRARGRRGADRRRC